MATDVEKLIVRLEVSQRKFEKQMAAANRTADKRARGIERRFMRMNKNLDRTFAGVGRSLAGVFAATVTARGAQRLVDSATKIDNALKVTGLSGEKLEKTFRTLFASAQENGAPLEALVELYSRVAMAADNLGASQDDLTTFADNVAKSLRVSGQSATEASGALLQLAQLMSGSVVQAQEYNSLIDGAYPLLQAVAAGLKEAGGDVGKLTQLVKAGKVPTQVFFRAFEAGSYVLNEKLAGAAFTVDQKFENFHTTLINTAREFNKNADAANLVGNELDDIAGFIKDISSAAIAGQKALSDYTGGIGNLGDAAWKAGAQLRELLGLPNLGEKWGINEWLGTAGQRPGRRTSEVEAGTGRKPGDEPATELPRVSITDHPASGSGGGGSGGSSRGGGRSPADQFADEIKSFKLRTASITATTAALARLNPLVDDYGYSIEKVHARQELLNAAERAGVKITPDIKKKITDLANGYATASAEAEKLARAQDDARHRAEDFRDMGRDAMGGFIRDLRDGVDASEALSNALAKIGDRLLDMALDNIFSSKGGGGGFLSGLFGGGKGLFGGAIIPGILHDGGQAGRDGYGHGRAVPASVFSGARRYHRGSMGVGLRSDEVPAILQKGETVLPRNYGGGAATGGGALDVRVISEVQNGNLVPVMTQVSGVVSGQQIRQANKTVPGRIVASQKRGV